MAYIDGASSGNPGDASVGVVVINNKHNKKETFSKYIGTATNNFAEYSALIFALERIIERDGKSMHVKSDSELLVKQLHGEYKIKNEQLKVLNAKVLTLVSKLESFSIEHIFREKNKEADNLAKKAISEFRRTNRIAAVQKIDCAEESPSSTGQRSG